MRLIFMILNYFDLCDHDLYFKGLKMATRESKLITQETFKCKKCGYETRKYYIQDQAK